MIYADYEFYQNSYLLGSDALIPEKQFNFFSNMASADVRNVIRMDMMDTSEPTDEMKMATCEIAELLYSLDTMHSESDSRDVISSQIASEKSENIPLLIQATQKQTEPKEKVMASEKSLESG
jgi:hypothetical protein